MQKKQILPGDMPRRYRCFPAIKACLILLLYTFSYQVYAQDQKVNLNRDSVTVIAALQELKKQTQLGFFFNKQEFNASKIVSIKARDQSLDKVLKEIFGQGFTFEYRDKMVIIRSGKSNIPSLPPDNAGKTQPPMITVTGIVTDQLQSPLPGVTVMIKGTLLGTTTNTEGQFKLNVPDKHSALLFSFVGMESKEIPLEGKTALKVILKEMTLNMDEVVVTGIFQKSRESYTGSVSVVTEKELKSFGNRNLVNTLRNVDPSFNILDNNEWGSDPNRLPEVQIRGASSLPDVEQLQDETKAALNTPLIILDGFEIPLQQMMDMNDNDVTSITILKDASATAIYGSRGANGVVVITTKQPAAGKLKISYSGEVNIEVPDLDGYNLLNAREKLELERQSGYYDATSPGEDIRLKQVYNEILTDVERGIDTYWLSVPLRVGVGQRHSLRLEGGDRTFKYSVSLQYNNTVGVMKQSKRNTFNGGVNLSYTHEKLLFKNDLRIGLNQSNDSPYGTFSDYAKQNPYWTPYNEKGEIKMYLSDISIDKNLPANPMYNAVIGTFKKSDYLDITNNFSIDWRPFAGFTARGMLGIKWKQENSDDFKPAEHSSFSTFNESQANDRGSYDYRTGKTTNYTATVTLNYSKVIAEQHMVYGGVSVDLSNDKSYNYMIKAIGFSSPSMDFLGAANSYPKSGKPGGTESTRRRIGIVGNLSYSFNDRYFADASFRTDGSSQFGKENRFAPFWSAGIGWNLVKEPFMQNVKGIDRLKLRASVGSTGSNNFSPYAAIATFIYNTKDSYKNWLGATQKNLDNPDLTWQNVMKYNIGIDLDMYDRRISFVADAYTNITHGLISSLELPPSNGFANYSANIGKLENKGVEVRLSGFIIRNTEKQINWNMTASLSYSTDKIIQLSEIMKKKNEELAKQGGASPNRILREGESQTILYAVPSLGIDPSTGKELLRKKDGSITYIWDAADRVACGNTQPKFRGNLNTSFRYKDLSISLSMRYQWGGQEYNNTLISRVENADKHYNVDDRVFYDRWKQPGDHTFFKGINETEATNYTSRFIEDKAYIACQNINVAYDLRDKKWLQYARLQSVSVRANMSDLFEFSTIKQERGTSFPFSRQFSLGLSVSF